MRLVAPLLVALICAPPAFAHDFWLQPTEFNVSVGEPVPMTIQVGHGPFRTRWSGAVDRVVLFSGTGPRGAVDLRPRLNPNPARDAVLAFDSPGTEVVAFQSTPAASNLPSIRFNDYIKVEGLAPAIRQRADARTTDAPGKEIYSRRCKVLIQVGAATGGQSQVTKPLGLTLEIVPERNPYALRPGEALPVRVLYEGRPLAGALVKLTNLEFDVRPVAMHLTDAAGRAAFALPHTGDWLINVIWTKPIKGNPAVDFETVFSSLTFGFQQSPTPRGAR